MAPYGAHGREKRAQTLGLIPGPARYLRGHAQATWVFVPMFSHLSNEDIIPTPLWAVRRLSHIGQTPSTMPSIVLCFFHYSSSLLGTGQRLTLAGLCPLAPAPWIMANPTQEPKRSRSSRKYWPAGTGKFPSHSLPNIDLLLEGPEPPSSGCGPGWFVSLQIHCV